jgi:hypothetical protein
MTNAIYHHYSGGGLDPCSLDPEFDRLALSSSLCPGCHSPKPDVKAVDVKILDPVPTGKWLSIAFGCFVPLVERRFLELLPEDVVRSQMFVGHVIGPDGKPFENWVTARCRHKAIVRGRNHVKLRVCEKCGRNVYFAMGHGYLYPAPQDGVEILESHRSGFILSDTLAQGIRLPKKGLNHQKLAVLDAPRDGLGAFGWRSEMPLIDP